jgi:hypothetical protein
MLKLIDGGKERRVYGSWHWLDREMHTAFTQLEGSDGTVPSEAIYEVRRGRQKPWAFLGRRLREARAADTPKEQVLEIVRVLATYVDRLYGDDRGTAA